MAEAGDLITERLLRVIDEGRRTATYKLALLLALIDDAATCPEDATVPTRRIATRVLELYYPQTRTFVAGDGIARELRQINMKGSPPLRAALRLRIRAEAAGCRSAVEASRVLPAEYQGALDDVETTFVRYPIPLLQVVGSRLVPFLYEASWPEGTSVQALRRERRDRLRFLPGVADRLVVLGPLLRPLIEVHWTRDVARWTRVGTEDERLRSHLFGATRTSVPPPLRRGLAALQANECFYCGDRLGPRSEVDHFLAWSRWPNDAVENLVLADRCNSAKREHLAARPHLDRWLARNASSADDLVRLADATRWISDPARSTALVRSTYAHIPAGTPLWLERDRFVTADGPLIA